MPTEQTPGGDAAQQTQTQPGRMIDDPLLSALADDLSILRKTEEATGKNEAPDIKPVVETPADGGTKPTDAPKTEAIKATVKQKPDIRKEIDDALTRHLADIKKPAAAPPALPDPKSQDEMDTSGLVDAQLEELEDAKFLEQKDPSKKGYAKKLYDFYKSVDKWVEDHKNDPDRTFDENDDEFSEYLEKNKPKWSPGERDKVRKSRLVEEAKREALKDIEPQLEAARREAREARVAPIVERKVSDFKTAFEKATSSDDPLEKDVYGRYRESAEALASDWIRLSEGLDDISKPRNQEQAGRHKWLMEFIGHQSQVFDAQGGEHKVRNGKQFVTPVKYAEIASSGKDTSKVWTFNNEDVLTMLQTQLVEHAKAQVKAEEDVALKRGFVRSRPSPASRQAEELKPTSGPRVVPNVAPGAANDSKVDDSGHPGKEVISILGLA